MKLSLNKWVIALLLISFYTNAVAQGKYKSDKLSVKPVFLLDANRSHILNNWVRVNGIRLGAQFANKYQAGIAWYSSEFIRGKDIKLNGKLFLTKTQFKATSLFIDYSVLSSYKWEVNVSSMFGNAKTLTELKRTDNLLDSNNVSNKIPLASFDAFAEYKIWPFVGLGLGLGYRQAFKNKNDRLQENISETFTSPFYSVKIKIHVIELYKLFFKPQQYKREKQNYRSSKKR